MTEIKSTSQYNTNFQVNQKKVNQKSVTNKKPLEIQNKQQIEPSESSEIKSYEKYDFNNSLNKGFSIPSQNLDLDENNQASNYDLTKSYTGTKISNSSFSNTLGLDYSLEEYGVEYSRENENLNTFDFSKNNKYQSGLSFDNKRGNLGINYDGQNLITLKPRVSKEIRFLPNGQVDPNRDVKLKVDLDGIRDIAKEEILEPLKQKYDGFSNTGKAITLTALAAAVVASGERVSIPLGETSVFGEELKFKLKTDFTEDDTAFEAKWNNFKLKADVEGNVSLGFNKEFTF